jgi:hypothetical protein
MPKTERFPKYRLHKSSGHAVVDLNSESFYLGVHTENVVRVNSGDWR